MMPIGAWAHIQYWSRPSNPPAPQPQSTFVSYPLWMTTITIESTAGSLFGPLQVVYEWLKAVYVQWTAAWRIYRLLTKLPRDRRRVATRVCNLLAMDDFAVARACARETSTTLGFNQSGAWEPIKRQLQGDLGRTENMYRSLRTRQQFEKLAAARLPNPELNLLIELGYHAYALDPQRPVTWQSTTKT